MLYSTVQISEIGETLCFSEVPVHSLTSQRQRSFQKLWHFLHPLNNKVKCGHFCVSWKFINCSVAAFLRKVALFILQVASNYERTLNWKPCQKCKRIWRVHPKDEADWCEINVTGDNSSLSFLKTHRPDSRWKRGSSVVEAPKSTSQVPTPRLSFRHRHISSQGQVTHCFCRVLSSQVLYLHPQLLLHWLGYFAAGFIWKRRDSQ